MGSAEKHTGMWPNMDYDCVVFVNVDSIPETTKNVYKLQSSIIMQWKNHMGDIRKVLDWGIVVSLQGVDVELLVAFAVPPNQSQRDGIMKIVKAKSTIEERIELSRALSTSLAESMVEYIKNETSETIEVIRLAKLWLKFSGQPKDVQGLNTLLELVCVHAVQTAEKPHCVMQCFIRFLELLKEHNTWSIKQDVVSLLSRSECDKILQEPYVINPENPYENMCNGRNVEMFLQCLKRRADKTLRQFENVGKAGSSKKPTWLRLLRLLYVGGSAKRHKVHRTVGKSLLYITEEKQDVYFVELEKYPSKKHEHRFVNLMRFICYSAAFIPREETSFEQYCNNLQKALSATTKLKLSRGSSTKGPNFQMRFPLPWGNGKGVCISGYLSPK